MFHENKNVQCVTMKQAWHRVVISSVGTKNLNNRLLGKRFEKNITLVRSFIS